MGVRKGQGYGIPKRKRGLCPECGKYGMSKFKPIPINGKFTRASECQYCSYMVVES